MATRTEVWNTAVRDYKKKRNPNIGRARSKVVGLEARTSERFKKIRSDVARARRFVNRGKKTRGLRQTWVAVAGLGKVTYGATKATYKVTAGTAKISYKAGKAGYKRVTPKVAGLTRKAETVAGRGLDRVLTSQAAEVARRRVIRGYARTRIKRRQIAGHLHQRATRHVVAHHQLSRLEEAASKALATRQRGRSVGVCAGCGTHFRTTKQVAEHYCRRAVEAEQRAIRRAHTKVAGRQKNRPDSCVPPGSGSNARINNPSGATEKGRTMASPTTASNGKGKLSFGGWRPETAEDLLDTFSKMGRQLHTEGQHLAELGQYLDTEREVDPRVIAKVEALQRVYELVSEGCKDIAKTFEKLYADELQQTKPKARKIVNEQEFFGQR